MTDQVFLGSDIAVGHNNSGPKEPAARELPVGVPQITFGGPDHYPDDVLPLWVAEMDGPLAEPVRQAVRALLDAHDVGYPPEDGALTTAFAGFAARRWGWRTKPQHTMTG